MPYSLRLDRHIGCIEEIPAIFKLNHMEKIHFTKVYLDKDPNKLPLWNGEYFVCRLGFKTVAEFKIGRSEISWLKEIRWYLNLDN